MVEREREAKPKAQKDILKIHGEKRRIPGKGNMEKNQSPISLSLSPLTKFLLLNGKSLKLNVIIYG